VILTSGKGKQSAKDTQSTVHLDGDSVSDEAREHMESNEQLHIIHRRNMDLGMNDVGD
jgi:hypothetical protein